MNIHTGELGDYEDLHGREKKRLLLRGYSEAEASAKAKESLVLVKAHEGLGRRVRKDDPCPCGSGKKFGKCCYRKRFTSAGMPRKAKEATE